MTMRPSNSPDSSPDAGMPPEHVEKTEVERKFLVKHLPTELMATSEVILMSQGYIYSSKDLGSIRLRRSNDRYSTTFKFGGGISRTEVENDITKEVFDANWLRTAGRRVEKTRHLIPLEGGIVAELDVYEGALAGHAVVEVEFPSTEAAAAFTPPDWFGEDVTLDGRHSNAALAEYGWPGNAPKEGAARDLGV